MGPILEPRQPPFAARPGPLSATHRPGDLHDAKLDLQKAQILGHWLARNGRQVALPPPNAAADLHQWPADLQADDFGEVRRTVGCNDLRGVALQVVS